MENMHTRHLVTILIFLLVLGPGVSTARDGYSPAKVVYDVSTANPDTLGVLLDRVSLLQDIYNNDPFEASIVLVIHESAIPMFARGDREQVQLLQRAESLTSAEIIQFRLCAVSARIQGFTKADFGEFVTMVPMADAEIVKLQNEGYAYLR